MLCFVRRTKRIKKILTKFWDFFASQDFKFETMQRFFFVENRNSFASCNLVSKFDRNNETCS